MKYLIISFPNKADKILITVSINNINSNISNNTECCKILKFSTNWKISDSPLFFVVSLPFTIVIKSSTPMINSNKSSYALSIFQSWLTLSSLSSLKMSIPLGLISFNCVKAASLSITTLFLLP